MLMEALHSTKNIPGLVKDISASPTCRIATGPRQGRTMFMWQTRPARGRQTGMMTKKQTRPGNFMLFHGKKTRPPFAAF